jgi:hydroxypyruvate reductase
VFHERPAGDSPVADVAVDCLSAGIEAARPARAVDRHCSLDGETLRIRDAEYDLSRFESVLVLGGGKAADGLAAALADRLDGGVDGAVVTDERVADPDAVTVHEGEHPTPGEGSVAGTEAVLERAEAAGEGTLVLAAVTGGGSALLCAPASGLAAADVAAVTEELLAAGAPIAALNTVRRACSEIKGGGLAAAAAPATVAGVLVSDVVGDDPAVVASGPTVPRESDPGAALSVLEAYGAEAPAVREWLERASPEAPPDVDVDVHVVASGRDAVDAAGEAATERGYTPCLLSAAVEGEASEAGRFHAAVAREVAATGSPVDPPAVLISGGETTVTVDGDGAGGPNLEFALGAALDLPASALVGAVDTDGSDGDTDAAGAVLGPVDDAAAARAALSNNDSYRFLGGRDALLRSGPTGTNVNDLRVVVVAKRF